MKKILLLSFSIIFYRSLQAQTFTNNTGGPIVEVGIENLYPVDVSGLPNAIDSLSFGVLSACFTIAHTYDADLDISLKAPDGTVTKLSNNNGAEQNNYTGTCVMEDATDGEISAAIAPFTGNFYPDQSLNKVNNGQNPNGTWYLLIMDETPGDTGNVISWSVSFGNDPPPTHEGGPCTTNNAIGCDCPDGSNDCDLLPDMINSALYIEDNWTEHNGYIRLGVATPNIGFGPLEMHGTGQCYCDTVLVNCSSECPDGSYPKENVMQTIYHKGGPTMTSYQVSAGTMTYHPQHQHIHIDNWTFNTLRIRGVDPDPTTWPILGTGNKISFCLINLGTCTASNKYCADENGIIYDKNSMPNGGLGNISGCDDDQGIYVGKYDAYDQYLDGQEIDFGDICDGQYYIVSQTDPFNEVVEISDSNNWSYVLVDLDHQQGICCATHFHADTTEGLVPFQVQFIDSTVPIAQSWLWDFGDGFTSADQFPQHVYTSPGVYTVTLSVTTSAGCTDTLTESEYITVGVATGNISLLDPADIHLTAFPNPANAVSNIQFNLDKPALLRLDVTDLAGNSLKTLFDGVHPSGNKSYALDMSDEQWPAGVYIVHATTGNREYYVKLVKL